MNDETKEAIALFRFGVLGPLVSARLEHGDRRAYFEAAAARRHVMPDGSEVAVSARTIEAWFYAHKRGGLRALRPQSRSDEGKSRAIDDVVADLIRRAKLEKPRRSVTRIIKMIERAGYAPKGELKRSSVHRVLEAAGISSRPVRGPSAERRSFIVERAGDLAVGDGLHMHKPVIAPTKKLIYPIMFSQIDAATRFITNSALVLAEGEGSADHERGLKAALLKFGAPRSYYVDHGPAYVARSLTAICADLDVELRHAGVGDPQAKGVIERWHSTWRAEVEDELPDHPLPFEEVQAKHWAWLRHEYHAREHDTTGRSPRDHFLEQAGELRAVRPGVNLDEVFLHRARRKVRNDGTVRWAGRLLEVRADLVGDVVEIRYDPNDLTVRPRVFVDQKFFCDTVPLDRLANAHRRRRRSVGTPPPQFEPTGLDPLGLIEEELEQQGRFERGALGRTRSSALDEGDDDDDDEDLR